MSGKLYVTGTPIGNLGDITYREVETMKSCDFIAAEDTRVTAKLLNYLEIKKPMISYHEHSAKHILPEIIDRIENGENCCIVTDAGMPCISDPGEPLVKACHERGIDVVAVPGATACMTALCISGQDTRRFVFEGFLPSTGSERNKRISELKDEKRTIIFYEAPHRLLRTLKDLSEAFGENRLLSICREITKIHEEVRIMSFSNAIEYFENTSPKGEFVLVIAGKSEEEQTKYSLEEAVELAIDFQKKGEKTTQAAKKAAEISGFKKSEIYAKMNEKKS